MSNQLSLFSSPDSGPKELLHKQWQQLPFLCIDTETTGLDPENNRIIEVAWITFEFEEEKSAQSELCAIDTELPELIINLTGITDAMLKDKPPFSEHADSIIEAMQKVKFIVAYNADFDRLFLEAEMRKVGKVLPQIPWVDPCVFIRKIDRYQKGKKLTDAAARWKVELQDAHRAMADAKATGLLLYKLAPHLKCESLPELVGKQQIWKEEQERSYNAYKARANFRNGDR